MTTKGTISGAWSIIRTCPYDGTESILGLYPEGKAALLKLEWFMDDPSDDEQYKLEYHLFESVEKLIEQHQTCRANRAEWEEKSRIYENYKAEQESKEIDRLLEYDYMDETGHREEDRVILPEDV